MTLSLLALVIVTSIARPQEVPTACYSAPLPSIVSAGQWTQDWAEGEMTLNLHTVYLDAGVWTLETDHHPAVAAVVIVDGHELTDGSTIRLATAGTVEVKTGAELKWPDEIGTCYTYRWRIVPKLPTGTLA